MPLDGPGNNTLEFWGERIIEVEGQMSRQRLTLNELAVHLSVAKRRYRQLVLEKALDALGPVTPKDREALHNSLENSPDERHRDTGVQKRPAPKRGASAVIAVATSASGAPRIKKQRSFAPVGICKACHRLSVNPGKRPGIAHTFSHDPLMGVCEKTMTRGEKKVGRRTKLEQATPPPQITFAEGGDVPPDTRSRET